MYFQDPSKWTFRQMTLMRNWPLPIIGRVLSNSIIPRSPISRRSLPSYQHWAVLGKSFHPEVVDTAFSREGCLTPHHLSSSPFYSPPVLRSASAEHWLRVRIQPVTRAPIHDQALHFFCVLLLPMLPMLSCCSCFRWSCCRCCCCCLCFRRFGCHCCCWYHYQDISITGLVQLYMDGYWPLEFDFWKSPLFTAQFILTGLESKL